MGLFARSILSLVCAGAICSAQDFEFTNLSLEELDREETRLSAPRSNRNEMSNISGIEDSVNDYSTKQKTIIKPKSSQNSSMASGDSDLKIESKLQDEPQIQSQEPVLEAKPVQIKPVRVVKPQDLEENSQNLDKKPQNLEKKPQNLEKKPQNLEKKSQAQKEQIVSVKPMQSPVTSQKVSLTDLQAQIEALQGQIAELKSKHATIDTKKLQNQIDELYDRVDDNELQTTLSKVKIGLELTAGNHNIIGKKGGETINNSGKFASEVHLNLNANINDRTKFTGRLSMAKYWGNIGNYNVGVHDFEGGKNMHGNSVLYFDRAYIDYGIVPGTLIATIGRLPGTDGPGSNLRNNSVRMSTYPALLFNAMGDAAVLTYRPDSLKDFRTALRLGYVKFYEAVDVDKTNARDLWIDTGRTDSDLFYASVESELPFGSLGKNLGILSYVHLNNISMPVYEASNGWTILDDVFTFGDLDALNFHFENYNTFGTKFSWFVSASWLKGSNPKDNSQELRNAVKKNLAMVSAIKMTVIMSNMLDLQTNIVDGVYTGTEIATATSLLQKLSAMVQGQTVDYDASTFEPEEVEMLLSLKNTSLGNAILQYEEAVQERVVEADDLKFNPKQSWAFHLGIRYDFTQALKLGFEYFYGSKYWYALSRTGINDPLDFRNTRGSVYDIYGIWQLDFNQYLRLSYTNIQYNYSNSGLPIGIPQRINDKANIISLIYNVRF